MVYAPADSVAQVAALGNNIKVAKNVQRHEQEIRMTRTKAESFLEGLDDVLTFVEQNPKAYSILPDDKRSKFDKLFRYDIENNGLANVETPNRSYHFAILNHPHIESVNDKTFIITFENEQGRRCSAKFSNCFEGFLNEIKYCY